MSDDLTQAEDELRQQVKWGESRETKVLSYMLKVARAVSRGSHVGVRIGNGPPTWIPDDNEQYFDRIGRRHYIGVDSQWLKSEPYT